MAEREFQRIANLLRQRSISITGKDLDIVVQRGFNSRKSNQKHVGVLQGKKK
jgi:hypothetical protein